MLYTRSRMFLLVKSLPTGSFAFVMVTGIVAIASRLHGFTEIGEILGVINWLDIAY